jgi:capsular polysaccharide biosynthesis protein
LQAGAFLTKDYQEIIKSREVVSQVQAQFAGEENISSLASNISVSIPTDTRIISITVRDENPVLAAELANSVRVAAVDVIKEVTKVEEVTTVEEAVPSSSPSSPNIKRNIALGMLMGAVVSITGIMLSEVLNDTVMRADDVEEVMGLTLLGIVPNSEKL